MRYLILAMALFAFNAEAAPEQSTAPKPIQAPTLVAKNPGFALAQKGDWIQGNPDSKVTVTEYASLSCPHCAVFNQTVFPQIEKKYIATNKIKFIYRDYPLNAPALRAGMVAHCTLEDKRVDMINKLYKTQEKWAFSKDFEINLQAVALEQGMTKKAFKNCLADKKIEEMVVKSRMDGTQELAVAGTPTVFINSERYNGVPDAAGLSAAIDKALAAQAKP